MTNEEVNNQVENMAVFNVAGYTFAMPMDDAMGVMLLLGKAKKYETQYIPAEERRGGGSAHRHYIGGDMPDIKVQLLEGTNYVEGVINGPRSRER